MARNHAQPQGWQGYYAGAASRFIAVIIDGLIVTILIAGLSWSIAALSSLIEMVSLSTAGGSDVITNMITDPDSLLRAIASVVLFVFYNIFFLANGGRTPGKAIVGIRVLTTDGRGLPLLRAILRVVIGYPLASIALGLGFFWLLIDDSRQGWHDKLAGTYVVYTWEARSVRLPLR